MPTESVAPPWKQSWWAKSPCPREGLFRPLRLAIEGFQRISTGHKMYTVSCIGWLGACRSQSRVVALLHRYWLCGPESRRLLVMPNIPYAIFKIYSASTHISTASHIHRKCYFDSTQLFLFFLASIRSSLPHSYRKFPDLHVQDKGSYCDQLRMFSLFCPRER